MKLTIHLTLLVSLIFSLQLSATHNRAGEITYVQIGPKTIQATITTYTKVSGQSYHADRSSLDLNWGDGITEEIPRDSFRMLAPDIRQNFYTAIHIYAVPSNYHQTYILSVKDPNRNENVLNVNGGNSVNVEFYLETEVFFFPTSSNIQNSSAQLLAPAIDVAYLGQVFQHTPAAFDLDGDSIVYELITPLMNQETPVPGYQMVDMIAPGPNNSWTFDAQTGIFSWNAPQQCGEYNIAYAIRSYRNGVATGYVVRDLQILVKCINQSGLGISGTETSMLRVDSSHWGLTQDWEFYLISPENQQAGVEVIAADFILNDLQTSLTQISPDSQLLRLSYSPENLNRDYDFFVNLVLRTYLIDPSGDQYAAYEAIPMVWEGPYTFVYTPAEPPVEAPIPAKELELVVLGNPVLNEIRVQSKAYYKNVKLEIYDLSGNLKHQERIAELENLWTKDVSNWTNGLYFLKFSTATNYKIMKVVIGK
jgi:hypothetical protein